MRKGAFLNLYDEDKLYDIIYYHNPSHWIDNKIDDLNPISDEAKWSEEIKYYEGGVISESIKNLPTNTVVYICFILKGSIFHLLKNMLFTSVGVIIQEEDNIFVNGQKNMILMNQGQILSE